MSRSDTDTQEGASQCLRAERRESARFPFCVRVPLRVEDPFKGISSVESCMLLDLSATGAAGVTRHPLQTGTKVILSIPTTICDGIIPLPEFFLGSAEVTWVRPDEGGYVHGGFRLDHHFAENEEFLLFAAHAAQRARPLS
jgi:hypothetical protein